MFNGRTDNSAQSIGDWFTKKKGSPDTAAALMSAAHNLTFTQVGIQTRNFRNSVLYGGYGYMAGTRFSASVIPPTGPLSAVSSSQGRMGPHVNLVNSIINTVLARLLANGAPHVTFLTNNGDFKMQHEAMLLEQFDEGLAYQIGFENVLARVLLDCCVFGTGILKTEVDGNDNIHQVRVFPNEIWTEAWDGREQEPRTIYQVGTADRFVLTSQYPKMKDKIMALKAMHPLDESTSSSFNTNMIAVWEAWHKDSPGVGGDGRWMKVLGKDITLEDQEFEGDFPLDFIRFSDVMSGFFGLGAAELLWGHQSSMNSVTRAEYLAHSQISLPRLYVDLATKLNENLLLSSRSGLLLKGVGPPPQALNWNATTENFVEWKNWIKADAFEQIGVSPMAATGSKPAGLDSQPSIREYMDQGDTRFSVLAKRMGQLCIDASKSRISAARRVYGKTGKLSVKVIGKKFIDEVNFKSIASLKESSYTQKLYETSALPRTPSGRLAMVQELMQGNLITVEVGRKLLQFPDLDEELGAANAAQENAEMTAYQLLHGDLDEFPTPDPCQRLDLCALEVGKQLLKALNNNAPLERTNRCRTWLAQVKPLLAPPPPPPPPQANPAPPPVSPLLPNAPGASPNPPPQ